MPTAAITKEMSIGEVIEQFPQVLDAVYDLFGGGCFTCPMYRVETVEQAAYAHCLDPDAVVAQLNQAIGAEEPAGTHLHADMTINDVLAAWPRTRPVFERLGLQHAHGHLTIAQAAQLRGVDPDRLLAEVRAAVTPALTP